MRRLLDLPLLLWTWGLVLWDSMDRETQEEDIYNE